MNIPDNAVFIIGSIINLKKEEYLSLTKKLRSHNIYSMSPIDLINDSSTADLENADKDKVINALVCYMSMCKTIVTLYDWGECPVSIKIIEIARLMGKEVLLSIQYLRKLDYEKGTS